MLLRVCFLQGVVSRLQLTSDKLADAEHQYTLILSSSRNTMMRVNLFMAVAMMFVACVALIPGWFGTNLNSYLQMDPTAFNRVTISIIGCLVVCVVVSCLALSKYLKE